MSQSQPRIRTLALGLFVAVLACALIGCGKRSKKKATATKSTAPQPHTPLDAGPANMPSPLQIPTEEPPPPVDPIAPDTVVVTVNGEEIKQRDVDDMLRKMLRIPPSNTRINIAQLRGRFGKQAEAQAIDLHLLEQAVSKAGIKADPAGVERKLKEITSNFPSPEIFKQQLERNGLTMEGLTDEIRRSIMMDTWLKSQATTPEPDDAAVKSYYESNQAAFTRQAQVRARHVLLKVDPGSDDEKKAKVKADIVALREKIATGGDGSFEKIAKEHSACPSGQQGGDLGLFPRGQMVPAFDKVAFELEPGAMSDIVETQFGFHIIKVISKHDAGVTPFEEVKEKIKHKLDQKRLGDAHTAALAALRKSAKIVRADDPANLPVAPVVKDK